MVSTVERREMFIGGHWQSAAEGETEPIVNPSTGETIAQVAKGTQTDVDRAVEAARKAFDEAWSETTPGERSILLWKLADRIEEHAAELAHIESENVGKPTAVAGADIEFAVDNLRFFAGAARILEGKSAGEYMQGPA
jgi:aminobutyraldehyde dehydrogenase